MACARLDGLSGIDRGEIHDAAAVLIGDTARLGACREGGAGLRPDVELRIDDGLLEHLRILHGCVRLNRLLVVLQGDGVGSVVCDGHRCGCVRTGHVDLLIREICTAVEGGLHGVGDLIVSILGCHPADEAAKSVLLYVLSLLLDALRGIAGEEIAVVGVVVIVGLCLVVPVLLQAVLRDQRVKIAVGKRPAVDTVRCLDGVRLCRRIKARRLRVRSVVLNARPASRIGRDADRDLAVVDGVSVVVLQVLNAGVHGEHAVRLGVVIVGIVLIQRGLMAGVAVPGAVQVVGHHVQEIDRVQESLIVDLCHLGGRGTHRGGELIVLAVLLLKVIETCPDVLHQEHEVLSILRRSLAALIDGDTVPLRIGGAVLARILPVDIDKVKAEVIDKPRDVPCKVLSARGICRHRREVAGSRPAAHGDADLQVRILIPQDLHAAEDAGIGIAVGKSRLFRQSGEEIRVLIAHDEISVRIAVHEGKVQVCQLLCVHVRRIIVVLPRVNRPVAIVHDVSIGRGGPCGICSDAGADRQCGDTKCHGRTCREGEHARGCPPQSPFSHRKIPFAVHDFLFGIRIPFSSLTVKPLPVR